MTRLFPCWESKKKKSSATTRLLCQHVHNGDIEAVRGLLRDLDVNDHNRFGRTPLHYACRAGQTEIVALLLAADAKLDALTRTSCSVAHECCRFNRGETLRHVLTLDRSLVWSVNTFGSLPVHAAAVSGSCDCIKVLLDFGTPLTNKNRRGMTPLHLACEGDRSDVALLLLTRDPWDQLYCRDQYDSTPLHHACMNGMTDVVVQCFRLHHHKTYTLLHTPDCAGTSALDYASKGGFSAIVKLVTDGPAAVLGDGGVGGSGGTPSHGSSDASSTRPILDWPGRVASSSSPLPSLEPVGDPADPSVAAVLPEPAAKSLHEVATPGPAPHAQQQQDSTCLPM